MIGMIGCERERVNSQQKGYVYAGKDIFRRSARFGG
jgi:hypothetical protein